MYALPLDDGCADTIIIHQVLHYAHSPAAAIEEAARVLGPDGRLLIVDFAAHEREELRSTDAHIRLGFDDEAMAGWFKAAGLTRRSCRTSGGRRADRDASGEACKGRAQRQRRAA